MLATSPTEIRNIIARLLLISSAFAFFGMNANPQSFAGSFWSKDYITGNIDLELRIGFAGCNCY